MNTLFYKSSSLALALLLLVQSFLCVPLSAQTGSPLQPEFSQPSTVGADDLVDLSSGDLSYSIPLFEIGGFPMNLTYSSDHKMEEEASWVGFGWNLNPGAISRQVRGVPDDFSGNEIIHKGSMADNVTTGISPGTDVEVFGAFGLSAGTNFTYNNYRGFDISRDLSPSINILAALDQSSYTKPTPPSNSNNSDSDSDSDNSPEVTTQETVAPDTKNNYKLRMSTNWNSTAGMSSINFYGSASKWKSAGANINFGGFSYTPVGEFPKDINAFTWHGKLGGSFWPVSMHRTLRGQKTVEKYATNVLNQAAYGYLYLQNGEDDDKAILDYNSASGGIFVDKSPTLPLAFGTPDIFSASGVGFSGQISVARNDVGIFHPPSVSSKTVPISVGGDLSPGNIVHVGANISVADVTVKKGPWKKRNNLEGRMEFAPNRLLRENAYMRVLGEPTTCLDMDWYNSIGTEDPIATTLAKGADLGPTARASFTRFTSRNRGAATTSRVGLPNRGAEDRRKRITSISYLTANEASYAAIRRTHPLHRPLFSADANFKSFNALTNIARLPNQSNTNQYAEGRKGHHLSEIRATTASGQRFIYGLPAYNQVKQEVSFNVSKPSNNIQGGLFTDQSSSSFGTVSYTAGRDDSPRNENGTDHYYDEIETKPYANSFLITSILSPDYVDRTNDGPSLDDLGQYVNFEYSSNASSSFRALGYRMPAQPGRATFIPGNLADPNDDKASFVYGTKEVYYPHHIDSKTHRAVFITSLRDDALTVENRKGDFEDSAPARLLQLDQIKIYTLAELNAKDEDWVPLKTIHFTYAKDHPQVDGITPGLPNHLNPNAGTKLTLASVHFTYADNNRGAENPYVFHYNTDVDGETIGYTPTRLDRWGNQRPVDQDKNPFWYPFALQNEEAAQYQALNNLDSIQLPTGGAIGIQYEADDYAYVQNKRAGKMYPIHNLSTEKTAANPACSTSNCDVEIYQTRPIAGFGDSREWLMVKIDDVPASGGADAGAEELVNKLYLDDVDQLYFDIEVDLGDNGYCKGDCRERVTGYLPKDYYTVDYVYSGSAITHLAFKLKDVNPSFNATRGGRIHPFTFAALDKISSQIPNLKFDMSNFNGALTIGAMVSLARQGGTIFSSFFRTKMSEGAARMINLDKSYIRLADGSMRKQGDGSRVSKVRLHDHWLKGDAENNEILKSMTTYTKVYDYTTPDEATGQRVSTGVAANEPMIGKSENLLVNVVRTPDKNFLAPDNSFYTETPVGMSFYPGGRVNYSKVTTTTELDKAYKQSRPGYSVAEFYTAKDFPVINRQTDVIRKKDIPLPISLSFVSTFRSRLALSQGYSIELNDMHGKPKKNTEYNYMGDEISSSEYIYNTGDAEDGVAKLNNLVDVVTRENTKEKKYLGQEVDMWLEMRQTASSTYGGGVQAQVDVGFPGGFIPIPVGVPTVYPNINTAFTNFRTSVATKVIKKYGILDRVIVKNNGAQLTNVNKHWDELTGQPTLTLTQNEFDQDIYSHTLPAYHLNKFESMGPAYLNEGAKLGVFVIIDGQLQGNDGGQNLQRILYPGDELSILEFGIFGEYVIRRGYVVPNENNQLVIVDEAGSLYNKSVGNIFAVQIPIISRSGRRNLLTQPAQQTVSLAAPNDLNYWRDNIKNQVLSSSANDYSDHWGDQCLPVSTVTIGQGEVGCDQLSDNFDQILASFFSTSDCNECEVRGVKFTAAEQQKLQDCELCDDLFEMYANNSWITDVETYFRPGADCNADGTVSLSSLTTDGRRRVNTCEFINADNPWFTSDGTVFRRNRRPDGTVIAPNPPGCDEHPCNLPATPGEDLLYGSNSQVYDSIDFSFITECFPRLPDGSGPGNPYYTGQRGVWRMESNYVAKVDDRLRANMPDMAVENGEFGQPALYRDGAIEEYSPYWNKNGINDDGKSHQFTSQVLAYDNAGNGIENIDAIGIRSSSQIGFRKEVPTAMVQNAAVKDIGYESFEDYNYNSGATPGNDWGRHFSALDNRTSKLTDEYSHTGLYSARITKGRYLNKIYNTQACGEADECEADDPCACLSSFAPAPAQEYVFSAWVANQQSLNYGLSPAGTNGSQTSMEIVSFRGANGTGGVLERTGRLPVTGEVIDGWQRLYGKVKLKEKARSISVRVYTSTSYDIYVDDFRIHPSESNMTSYAYNPHTMRLMAQMDENGYAVFYEYDDEGMLVRQKRETEKGIMTITEQRSNVATQTKK